ncbi:MAG TPA: arsenate reductase family protein [Bacteroidales bacterium]|nr:arsenate reductase family protein [Bacteroidales bacterium]
MLHVFGIKNCNKIRDTLSWLDEHNVDYTFNSVKKEPLTREELREVADKVGLDVLVNRRGRKWRDLGLAGKDLDEDELFEILLENQVMIKRPLIVDEDAVIVGYDETAFEAFTGAGGEEEDKPAGGETSQ